MLLGFLTCSFQLDSRFLKCVSVRAGNLIREQEISFIFKCTVCRVVGIQTTLPVEGQELVLCFSTRRLIYASVLSTQQARLIQEESSGTNPAMALSVLSRSKSMLL